jgi:hypothetical protein
VAVAYDAAQRELHQDAAALDVVRTRLLALVAYGEPTDWALRLAFDQLPLKAALQWKTGSLPLIEVILNVCARIRGYERGTGAVISEGASPTVVAEIRAGAASVFRCMLDLVRTLTTSQECTLPAVPHLRTLCSDPRDIVFQDVVALAITDCDAFVGTVAYDSTVMHFVHAEAARIFRKASDTGILTAACRLGLRGTDTPWFMTRAIACMTVEEFGKSMTESNEGYSIAAAYGDPTRSEMARLGALQHLMHLQQYERSLFDQVCGCLGHWSGVAQQYKREADDILQQAARNANWKGQGLFVNQRDVLQRQESMLFLVETRCVSAVNQFLLDRSYDSALECLRRLQCISLQRNNLAAFQDHDIVATLVTPASRLRMSDRQLDAKLVAAAVRAKDGPSIIAIATVLGIRHPRAWTDLFVALTETTIAASSKTPDAPLDVSAAEALRVSSATVHPTLIAELSTALASATARRDKDKTAAKRAERLSAVLVELGKRHVPW